MLHALVWLVYIVGLVIVFISQGTLGWPWYAQAAGWLLMFAGGFLIFYSKQWLGRHYVRIPKLVRGHVLVTDGPYAYVRHPEYVGILLAYLGLCLVQNSLAGIVFLAFGFVPMHALLAYQEEALLLQNFKAEHEAYQKKAGLLLPRSLTFWYPFIAGRKAGLPEGRQEAKAGHRKR